MPIPSIDAEKLEVVCERLRPKFEDCVFRQYFISCVGQNLKLKVEPMPKARFCRRSADDGEYIKKYVGAAWWSWKELVKQLILSGTMSYEDFDKWQP